MKRTSIETGGSPNGTAANADKRAKPNPAADEEADDDGGGDNAETITVQCNRRLSNGTIVLTLSEVRHIPINAEIEADDMIRADAAREDDDVSTSSLPAVAAAASADAISTMSAAVVIKTEPSTSTYTAAAAAAVGPAWPTIKCEPKLETNSPRSDGVAAASGSSGAASATTDHTSSMADAAVVKTEPSASTSSDACNCDDQTSKIAHASSASPVLCRTCYRTLSHTKWQSQASTSSNSIDAPVAAVAAAPTPSPQQRATCNFGIKCYRRNLQHRNDMAHPGDPDYRRPDFPAAPAGTPDCPFGAHCYRREPGHFRQLSHPPSAVYSTDANGAGSGTMPIMMTAPTSTTNPVLRTIGPPASPDPFSDVEGDNDPYLDDYDDDDDDDYDEDLDYAANLHDDMSDFDDYMSDSSADLE